MSRRLEKAVDRWLRAERAGSSERELARVLRALPAPRLPDGFSDRVMLAVGLARARPAALALPWRLAVVLALVLTAGAAATAPRLALGLAGRISVGDLLRLAAAGVVETCHRLAEGLAVWQSLGSIADTLAAVLSAPPVLAALLAASLLSAGGLRMLYGLLAIDGRPENARP